MAVPALRYTIRLMARPARRKLKTAMWVAITCALLLTAIAVSSRIYGKLYPLAHLVLEDIPQGTPGKTMLKVGTYNIAHSRGCGTDVSNWTGRTRRLVIAHLNMIAAQIKASDCDIVVLNEVDFDSTWSRRIDAAAHIAKAAGYRYVCEQKNAHVGVPFLKCSFGNAILSKYPLSHETLISLPALSAVENLLAGKHDAVTCTADTPIGDIEVVGVHLDSRDEAIRVGGMRTILGHDGVAAARMPTVLLGDFNSTPSGTPTVPKTAEGDNAMDVLLEGKGYHTLLPQGPADYTFSAEAPVRTIDYIVVSDDLAILERQTIRSQLSDHFMVAMTVALRQQHAE